MHSFVTDRSFEKVAPHRAPDVTVIAKIRLECDLDLETVPGYGTEDSPYLQLRLSEGSLEKPRQIRRNFLRWLLPNLGCNLAAVLRPPGYTLIAFGRARGDGIDLGGAHFDASVRMLPIRTALAQIGNSFFWEGEDRIVYPAIVLGTQSIILPS